MKEIVSINKLLYKFYNFFWAYRNPVEYWERKGERYDDYDYVTQRFPDDEWLLSFIANGKFSSVLEVGCATGRLIKLLASNHSSGLSRPLDIKGVDSSNSMLEVARKKVGDYPGVSVQFLCQNALDLQFEKNSIEVVYTRGLLMHLKDECEVRKTILDMVNISQKHCVLIEEISKGELPFSGYSPNGIARWWNYQDILRSLNLNVSAPQYFQNKELLVVYVINKR